MENVINEPLTLRTQASAVIGSLVLLAFIVNLVRKGYIREGYSILWLFTGILILSLSVFNGLLFWLTDKLGIIYAPATLFLFLIIGLILISIHYSTVITRHERKIKDLAQEIGLIKNKLRETNKK